MRRNRRRGRVSKAAGLIWRVVYPLLLYFVMAAVFQAVPMLIFPVLAEDANVMWLIAISDALMIPVFAWLYRMDRKREMTYTGGVYWYDKPVRRDEGRPSVYVWALLGGIVLSRVFNILIYLSPLPDLFPGYSDLTEAVYAGSLISQICASVIAAPVMEELLMRGVIYGRLKRGIRNRAAAALLGALVFGLFHGNVVQGVYAFLMGLFFIWVYDKSGSLLAPILAHMAANGSSILVQWISSGL